MAKKFSKYENAQEYVWYDSTNVFFSKCYDNPGMLKVVKIVFKGGRCYLYKDVDANDYVLFRDHPSTGEGFSRHIKKYQATRIQDTDLTELDNLKKKFEEEVQEKFTTPVSELNYIIDYVDQSGEFALRIGDKTIYRGKEGEVSIINLFRSMGFGFTLNAVDKIENETDEESDKIELS